MNSPNTDVSQPDPSPSDDELRDILTSKRPVLGNKEQRKALILDLVKEGSDIFNEAMRNDDDVKGWYRSHDKEVTKNIKWNNTFVANGLIDFRKLLEQSRSSPNHSAPAYGADHPITRFDNLMTTADDIIMNLKKAGNSTGGGKKVNPFSSKHQGVQDANPFDEEWKEPGNCPVCNHGYLMNVSKEAEAAVQAYNKQLRKDYMVAKSKWDARSPTEQKLHPKPKLAKVKESTLACYCCKMNCNNQVSGQGCLKCKSAVDYAKSQGQQARPMFNANGDCTCATCGCACSAVFKRSEKKKLIKQVQKEQFNKSTEAQDQMSCFKDFRSMMESQVLSNFSQETSANPHADECKALDNAYSRASYQLITDDNIQGQVHLRNNLQKQIPASAFVKNAHISEHRHQKRMKKSSLANVPSQSSKFRRNKLDPISAQAIFNKEVTMNQSLTSLQSQFGLINDKTPPSKANIPTNPSSIIPTVSPYEHDPYRDGGYSSPENVHTDIPKVNELEDNPPQFENDLSPTSERTKLVNELVTLCVDDCNAVLVARIFNKNDRLVQNIINAAVNTPARDLYSFLICALAQES